LAENFLKFVEEDNWTVDADLPGPGPTAVNQTLAPNPEWEASSLIPWKMQPILTETLEYFVEAGDVQTAVVLSFILREHCQVDQALLTLWIVSYIELLQRRRLFSAANDVIRFSGIESVRNANQKSTTIHTGCPHCRKPLYKSGIQCDDCKKRTNVCSICHELVRGMYLWCQTCGHGGHATHIREWFRTNFACPTGCRHLCHFAKKA